MDYVLQKKKIKEPYFTNLASNEPILQI